MPAPIPARPVPAALLTALLMTLAPAPLFADEALSGVDAVSLRDTGRAVEGGVAVTHWRGSEWHFANETNRAAFEANPRAYSPAFGGNCPVALAEGERRPGRSDLFVVIDQTIYLTSSPDARDRLETDGALIEAARAEWKRLAR